MGHVNHKSKPVYVTAIDLQRLTKLRLDEVLGMRNHEHFFHFQLYTEAVCVLLC